MGRSSLSSDAVAASAQLQVSEMRCNIKAPGPRHKVLEGCEDEQEGVVS